MSSRLDEVKGQLSDYESRESKTLEELERTKGDLGTREAQVKNMEGEIQKKWKALEQAQAREDKLVHKLQQVHVYMYDTQWACMHYTSDLAGN